MSSGVLRGRQGWPWRALQGWPTHPTGALYTYLGHCTFLLGSALLLGACSTGHVQLPQAQGRGLLVKCTGHVLTCRQPCAQCAVVGDGAFPGVFSATHGHVHVCTT